MSSNKSALLGYKARIDQEYLHIVVVKRYRNSDLT